MQHALSIGLIVLLIAFGLYRRIRRTVGFQLLSRGRMRTRMILVLVVLVLFLFPGSLHPISYAYDAIGILIGIGIAVIGIRTTSFERRPKGWYYRPHPWIGALLIVLLVVRIGIRAYEAVRMADNPAAMQAAGNNGFSTYASDPLTAMFLFVLFTYYVVYYFFVLRRSNHLDDSPEAVDDKLES